MLINEKLLAQGKYENAQSAIDNFEPVTNIENNFKTYFQLYRNFRVNELLNETEESQLQILAAQCPGKDGPAVFKARALLNHLLNDLIDYDDQNCELQGYSRPSKGVDESDVALNQMLIQNEKNVVNKKVVKTENIKIYPNPTSNSVIISGLKKDGQMSVYLTDALGRNLITTILNFEKGKSRLDFKLDEGIYLIHIKINQNEFVVKKIIVSKEF